MSATPSTMLPLGTLAPEFELLDTITGVQKSLASLRGEQATVVIFMCNHCPYVIHVQQQLIEIANYYATKCVATIGISSNDIVNYPQDAPEKMTELMQAWGQPFSAYLYDETQAVAKAYQAACTPDIYVFDSELLCVYRGRLDASTPKNSEPLTGKDLRSALDNLLAGTAISTEQIPSIGCNIKWK